MITHSQEFPTSREFAAYEAFVAAVRAYADATERNDLITPEGVAEIAGRTYGLECERARRDHRIQAAIRADAIREDIRRNAT